MAAIVGRQVGKRYSLGQRDTNRTLRDALVRGLRRERAQSRTIWALRGANFDVERGSALGIIGHNGAGKSTLLKILSRITRPSEGQVRMNGRVGSLLEVGTGFHPELTGRENAMMSGAILGMGRQEIRRKLDVIVDFAGVEAFVDTPVKHYSSGMYVRLAFAVAAHLEPDILLVDEVLAVGDANFQKKCLGRMGDVASEGRTVIFVSHNMAAITRLCRDVMWLDRGAVHATGPSQELVSRYLTEALANTTEAALPADSSRSMRLRRVRVGPDDGGPIEFSSPVRVRVEYDVNEVVSGAHVIVFVQTQEGVLLLGSGDADLDPSRLGERVRGRHRGEVSIPPGLLGEGTYSLTVSLGIPGVEAFDRHEGICSFEIVDQTSRRREWMHQRRPGILGVEIPWQTTHVDEQVSD